MCLEEKIFGQFLCIRAPISGYGFEPKRTVQPGRRAVARIINKRVFPKLSLPPPGHRQRKRRSYAPPPPRTTNDNDRCLPFLWSLPEERPDPTPHRPRQEHACREPASQSGHEPGDLRPPQRDGRPRRPSDARGRQRSGGSGGGDGISKGGGLPMCSPLGGLDTATPPPRVTVDTTSEALPPSSPNGHADAPGAGGPDRTSKGGDGGGIRGIAGGGDEQQEQHKGLGQAPTPHWRARV